MGRPGLSHGQQTVGAVCPPCEGWEAERAADGRVLLARPRGRLIEDGSDVRRRMGRPAWQHMMDLRRGGLARPGTHLLQAVTAPARAATAGGGVPDLHQLQLRVGARSEVSLLTQQRRHRPAELSIEAPAEIADRGRQLLQPLVSSTPPRLSNQPSPCTSCTASSCIQP